VNTWKKKPVTLIVADAGPLISLACADHLDLLQTFGRPVLIVDVVQAECTRKLNAPGEERLTHWFDVGGGNQFQLVSTPFLKLYQDALQKELSGEDPEATQGFGDATIAWLIKNLGRVRSKDDIALVLTQDAPFGDGPVLGQRHAHVLSTREWLKTLERLEVIPSAKQIITEMEDGGRKVARYMADRPADLARGTRSDWKDGTEQIAKQIGRHSDKSQTSE
jgi:hypothetical protein